MNLMRVLLIVAATIGVGNGEKSELSGSWSAWHSSPCRSGCLAGSRAFMLKMRACVHTTGNGNMVKAAEGCEQGPSLMFDFCDAHAHHQLCKGRMMDKEHYAARKCRHFAGLVPERIDSFAMGMQPKHRHDMPRRACTIYCSSAHKEGTWYAPVKELADSSVRPFFPDGTLCHQEGNVNFYCQRTICLPQSARWAGKKKPKLY